MLLGYSAIGGGNELKILLASSEVAPFSKSGGLADVCSALPIALRRLGHEVAVITPAYRCVFEAGRSIEKTGIRFDIPISNKVISGDLLRSQLDDVPVYFVEQPQYYDRPQLYREGDRDYEDNCERFVFFCRSVLEAVRLLGGDFDIVHGNDWQCGLVPAYLQIEYAHTRGYENVASVFTIHNMAYQGVFWHWDMLLTGLDWKYFNWKQMEFYGQLNLLKTALVFSDMISTVSRRYAEEICEPPLGSGLEGVLQQRRSVLRGILNGVSYEDWDPATDPHLAQRYRAEDWQAGKAACKRALQQETNLPQYAEVPLIGIVGRLVDQKGWDLIAGVIKRWAQYESVQWVILGTGEKIYEQLLAQLSAEYPSRIAARFAFSEALAHRIEAGADLFLMPSRFEPCGLNQMYSLKYGTVPVVRATGGLADTITDATEENLRTGAANGFSFVPYEAEALEVTLQRACNTFRDNKPVWQQLVETGVRQDWSWNESAKQYVQMYADTLQRKGSRP
jgi:starch synthase